MATPEITKPEIVKVITDPKAVHEAIQSMVIVPEEVSINDLKGLRGDALYLLYMSGEERELEDSDPINGTSKITFGEIGKALKEKGII